MRIFLLAAGVAAMAISTPALAQGKGKGHDKGGNAAAKAQHGNPGKGNGGPKMKAKGQGNGNAHRGGPPAKADKAIAKANRGNGNAKFKVRGNQGRGNDNVRAVRVADRSPDFFRYGSVGAVNGCPPGLAKKHNGCLPPGQAKQLIGTRAGAALLGGLLGGPYATWYRDNDYRYRMDDRYIYRIGANNLIDGLIPLYDRPGYYYPVGMRYPDPYNFYNLPVQYRGYYDDPYYRYGDGAIYRINPETQIIQGIAALLTGDVTVGQPLPSAYSVYNVPYGYRSAYRDDPRNYYRYSDGYIYRVDPTTLLVAEVVKAII